MTPLGRVIARRIAATGPITVAEYMAECLLHPDHGYYTTRDPLGATGDFTTAPEISQMFGELLGLCLAQAWMDQGAPDPLILAELGPGRGTLMADMLRAARALPAFRAAINVHLVEASPTLRARQSETLAGAGATWHGHVEELPEGPLYLVANEFFDALPIRQFLRDRGGWRERVIGLETTETLRFGLTDPTDVAALAHRHSETRDGDVVEICPAAAPIAGEIGRRIATHGGAALILDYGGMRSLGDTLQAVKAHAFADPLAEPGLADLTAHVDFGALATAATPAAATDVVPQGVLLGRLGIAARAAALAERLDGEARARHLAAWHRLTDPSEMGTVFKAIAFHPPAHPPPPGFA